MLTYKIKNKKKIRQKLRKGYNKNRQMMRIYLRFYRSLVEGMDGVLYAIHLSNQMSFTKKSNNET
jgi:hypothetical protein